MTNPPQMLDGLGHPVVVGEGVLDSLGELCLAWAPSHRYAVITDVNVGRLYADRVAAGFSRAGAHADVFTFPAGESHKTRATWTVLTDELLSTGFGRDSSIVALGGGVVGDLAGFVAATFMRGIPVLQVPTTLVAMVDSSIGGKTGVDVPAGKNLVGAFHLPAGVVTDPQVLATLPFREFQAGLAEVLKHGVIADESFFFEVAEALPELLSVDHGGMAKLQQIIARSIALKIRIVGTDFGEAGARKVLNFGHTIGHAVEAASGFSLLHGEAVAIGMVTEAAAAELAGVAQGGTADTIRGALVAAGLPVELPDGLSATAVLAAAATDKKKRAGVLEFSVPCRVGEMARSGIGWTVRLSEDVLLEALR
ncbi:MAG TPA: 3-dehydroquinate synthase [Gemmatimonadaceae bacterium]|nr:3-dehydroquinate synthase [Gemmatimonadaceae bacterium]